MTIFITVLILAASLALCAFFGYIGARIVWEEACKVELQKIEAIKKILNGMK